MFPRKEDKTCVGVQQQASVACVIREEPTVGRIRGTRTGSVITNRVNKQCQLVSVAAWKVEQDEGQQECSATRHVASRDATICIERYVVLPELERHQSKQQLLQNGKV